MKRYLIGIGIIVTSLVAGLIATNKKPEIMTGSGFYNQQSSGGGTFVGGSITATTTFADNIPACFGTDCDFSIRYNTVAAPDVGVITAPTSSNILVFNTNEFKDYDYFGNAGLASNNAILAFAPPSTTKNYTGIISLSIDGGGAGPGSRFSMSTISTDDIGLSVAAEGVSIDISAGNSGTLGGNGGSLFLAAGDALTSTDEAGRIIFRLYENASSTGKGYISMDSGTDLTDFRFKNTGASTFKILDSESEQNLSFDHNGTNAIILASTGTVKFATTSISFSTSSSGIILPSPDGTCYKIQIANGGTFATSTITCP